MDPAFPFELPTALVPLVLAYACTETAKIRDWFDELCTQGKQALAQRVVALFSPGVPFNGGNALRAVSAGGHLELARWLAEHFALTAADARDWDNHALRWACARGQLSTARWLVEHFGLTAADARASDNHALNRACVLNQLSAVCWLVGRFGLTLTDGRASGVLRDNIPEIPEAWILKRFEPGSSGRTRP
jgi:hypothetical protein